MRDRVFFIIVRFATGDGGIYILLVSLPLKDRLSDDETVNRDYRRRRVGALLKRASSPDLPTAATHPLYKK
jgi:hypothetical protein